tara:strand:- start:149 stop:493 length:345 start_codon:yes stop_codon:yes gene_type:complete
MKDKRTYTNIKEYGEDMSYENDTSITNEDRGPGDLTLLLEQHQKEIWAWKQKEMEWNRTLNLLEGNKKIVEELSSKLVDIRKFNQNLEAEIKNLQYDNETYKEEIKKLLAEKHK